MANNVDDDFRPSRIHAAPAWLIYILVIFFALGLGGGLWYALAPQSMAKTFGSLNKDPLTVESLSLTLDRRTVEIAPNGAIEIHPAQTFGIAGLNSNRWQNYDLRLVSPDIDIAAVTDGSLSTIRDLLPGELFENTREVHITVFDGDVEAADFKILSRYSALDFVTRGDATNDREAKAGFYQKAYQLDPDSELIRGKLVTALAELGKAQPAQTASIYENLLAQDGPNEDLMIRLAEVYEADGKDKRLVDILGQLIEHVEAKGGSSRPYRQRLADAHAKAGRLNEAVDIYEKLLVGATMPDKVGLLRQLVNIHGQNRDSERGLDALKRLVEIAPPDQAPLILTDIAVLYEKTDDSEGRLSAWKNLAEKLPDGELKVEIYKNIGRLLAQEEKYAEAMQFYQAALKINSKDINTLMNLAHLAYRVKDSKAYIDNLSKAVELVPDNFDYRRELADALAAAKQNTRAKEEYQELLKRKPEDQNLRLVFIDFLDKIEKKDDKDKKMMLSQYEELAKRNADNKVIPYNIGDLHFQLKQWDKAIESFQEVLKKDPEDMEAREYLLAAYQRKNKKADILREAMEIYKRAPDKTNYRTLLLNTHENDKNWKEFAQVAKSITEIEPNSAFGWEQLYRAQTQSKDNAAAAESLWQIAAKTTDKKKAETAWVRAAKALADLKKKDRAEQAYKKALEINPDNKQALAALNK